MNTTSLGRAAEAYVAEHLTRIGYSVQARNWRVQACEIDIVAAKDNIAYFVEVKFRGDDRQGGGLEYITPKKLAQMRFAAGVWVQRHAWQGDYRLLAVAVSGNGQDFRIDELVEAD